MRNFRPGDFVRVGERLGRVTERGLFHTEIQTEDRDLTTLPNLYLVTNPVTVVRASGTIVSTTVDGTAKPRDVRGDTVACSSKGQIERRVAELVTELLGGSADRDTTGYAAI